MTATPLRLVDEEGSRQLIARLAAQGRSEGWDQEAAERQAAEDVEAAEHYHRLTQIVAGEAWLASCPRRYVDADLEVDVRQPAEILEPVLRWLRATRAGVGENLILLGPTSTGKTHLAMAVAKVLHFDGHAMRFVPEPELLDALRPDGGEETAAFTSPPVLVLDDLGTEKPTEWSVVKLAQVLNRRYLDRRPTIVTTNLEGDALAAVYGERVCERLQEGALSLYIGGASRRRPGATP